MAICGLSPDALLPEIDGVRGLTAFLLEDVPSADRVLTYHIAEPQCLISADEIRHRPIGQPSTASVGETVTAGWLPRTGPLVVGLTAGASTPNNLVGQVIGRIGELAGEKRR